VAGIAREAADAINALVDTRDQLSRERHDEIRELRIAIAKIDKTMSDLQRRDEEAKRTFQFAREKIDEIIDLPNPLPPRRDVN
jgi:hypothetical protein